MSAKQSEYFNKDFEVLNPDKLKIACVVSEWHNCLLYTSPSPRD